MTYKIRIVFERGIDEYDNCSTIIRELLQRRKSVENEKTNETADDERIKKWRIYEPTNH